MRNNKMTLFSYLVQPLSLMVDDNE